MVTGGPELLHQLVHELRSLGREAYIAYYPFDQEFSCPLPYRKYDVQQSKIVDDNNTFILLPEVATHLVRRIKKARVGIWWLSVDNYFPIMHNSKLKDIYSRYISLVLGRLPMKSMKGILHFAQSDYAFHFLKEAGIYSVPLSDYLSHDHLVDAYNGDGSDKSDIIVFNPKKGRNKTKHLLKRYPNFSFAPIENMTQIQVSKLLKTAKIYMDFGHHPGKDRLPREAAVAGCCVITGRKGSANYFKDMPIPSKYKLDDGSKEYIEKFGALATSIFSDYSGHSIEFSHYRDHILQEQVEFKLQVSAIFT
jgi:hypothetical protein